MILPVWRKVTFRYSDVFAGVGVEIGNAVR
jgi:hypothetical protein